MNGYTLVSISICFLSVVISINNTNSRLYDIDFTLREIKKELHKLNNRQSNNDEDIKEI